MRKTFLIVAVCIGLIMSMSTPANAITANATTCNEVKVGKADVYACHIWLWYGGNTNRWITGATISGRSLCVESLTGAPIRFVADQMPGGRNRSAVYSINKASGSQTSSRCVTDTSSLYASGKDYERIRIEWKNPSTGKVCRSYMWFDRYSVSHKTDTLPCDIKL